MKAQPTKEVVRQWLQQRQTHRELLPPIEQIRRELGWSLIEAGDTKAKKESLLAN